MSPENTRKNDSASIGSDTLFGAEEISEFLYGDPGKRRKVYWLASQNQLPVFRLGAMICARRSTLLEHIKKQEREGASGQAA